MVSSISKLGLRLPISHADTVPFATFSSSASVPCVNPFFFLISLILSPIVIACHLVIYFRISLYLVCFCSNSITQCCTCQYTMMYFLQFVYHSVLLQALTSTS